MNPLNSKEALSEAAIKASIEALDYLAQRVFTREQLPVVVRHHIFLITKGLFAGKVRVHTSSVFSPVLGAVVSDGLSSVLAKMGKPHITFDASSGWFTVERRKLQVPGEVVATYYTLQDWDDQYLAKDKQSRTSDLHEAYQASSPTDLKALMAEWEGVFRVVKVVVTYMKVEHTTVIPS